MDWIRGERITSVKGKTPRLVNYRNSGAHVWRLRKELLTSKLMSSK